MNPRPVEFLREAVAEAAEARRWYANIDSELGDDFAEALENAVARVAAGPLRGAPYLHGTRAMMVERFPYIVVYRALEDRIGVVAIQHARRRPGYWRSRVRR